MAEWLFKSRKPMTIADILAKGKGNAGWAYPQSAYNLLK
jgi:hypothetical protein